jgi:hypothetical protein
MRKSLIPLLSVLVVMLFTATAFALHAVPEMYEYQPQIVKSSKAQLTLGGSIRIRGEHNDNLSDFRDKDNKGSYDDSNEFYDQRIRLNIQATVSPNTLGFVELENGDDTSDGIKWGYGFSEGASGLYQISNSKRGSLYIRQAYVAHQGRGLGILTGFKAGHMLMGLGNGLFYDHTKYGDDALVFWLSPAEGVEFSLNTIKLSEGTSTVFSDDANAYVVTAAASVGPASLSGDITYVDDNDFAGTTKALDFYNVGFRGEVAAGPVNIKGDIEIQTGKAKKLKDNGDDLKFKGLALMVGADINAGPVTITAGAAYGSGDKIDTENKYEGFINSISSGQHYTYIYDHKALTAGQALSTSTTASSTYAGANNTGLNNTWYLNAGVSVNPISALKISGDLYYLQAAKKVSKATDMDKKDIGVELDAKVEYQIDSNLVYFVEAGYLFAGDFYANVTGNKSKIDDPYSIRHGIQLEF